MKLTQDQREEYEERAAILEYDGHLPRPLAEKEAMRLTLAKVKGKEEQINYEASPH